MSAAAAPRHWLLAVAERVGLPGADRLTVAPGVPVPEAWAQVCEGTGIAPTDLAAHVAAHYRLAVADLERAEHKALKLVPESVARRYGVLPLRETNRDLFVATSDPTDLAVEQALGFASGRAPVFEIAPPSEIEEVIESLYSPERALEGLLQAVPAGELDRVSVVEEEMAEKVSAHEAEMAPVVKLTNLILREAVEQGASDIHIEPGRAGGHVRFRVDGVMRQYMQLPMPALNRVVSRVKILSGLDIADRLRPQDGKTRIRVREKSLDVRVSTVPIRDSEKAVLRILDPQGSLGLEDLGFPQIELDHVRQLLQFRDGIVLVTGPTGSGKTTTLYAALQELSTGETNIMTVEDPVEYELPGIAQIQIEPRRGVTFASALRAALRQDPDVILVGEVRDLETAEVALQASLTGHLVLATLHTNDAVGSIARLVDLGLDRALVAESLRGAVAQRLGRRVCAECVAAVEAEDVTETDVRLQRQYGVATTLRGAGCRRCGQTGYRGRAAFVEALMITPAIKRLIAQGADSSTITAAAQKEGFRLIREVALEAVRDGVTTLEEVDRTLGESAETVAAVVGGGGGRTTAEIVAATLAAAAGRPDGHRVRDG
ncbi:MAG: GspE/PulE family protein, partial [Gemmatimonadales bacterium]